MKINTYGADWKCPKCGRMNPLLNPLVCGWCAAEKKVEIKDMTDAEWVEAVAMTIPHLHKTGSDWWYYSNTVPSGQRFWQPFTDLNDLFMVIKPYDGWECGSDGEAGFYCVVWHKGKQFSVVNRPTLPHAVFEAALTAERSEK